MILYFYILYNHLPTLKLSISYLIINEAQIKIFYIIAWLFVTHIKSYEITSKNKI
jgi:hypothetical protein